MRLDHRICSFGFEHALWYRMYLLPCESLLPSCHPAALAGVFTGWTLPQLLSSSLWKHRVEASHTGTCASGVFGCTGPHTVACVYSKATYVFSGWKTASLGLEWCQVIVDASSSISFAEPAVTHVVTHCVRWSFGQGSALLTGSVQRASQTCERP